MSDLHAPIEATPPPSAFAMVSDLLQWIAERAAPFAALTIGISAFLWSDFRREFELPISFASGSVLSALPAIFAVVCGAAIVLFIAALLPALVLVTPVVMNGPRLADIMRRPVQSPDAPGASLSLASKAEKWIFRYWQITAVVDVLLWACAIWWGTANPEAPIWPSLVGVLIVILLQSTVGWLVVRHVSPPSTKPSKMFIFFLGLAQFTQAYIGFAVLLVVLSTSEGSDPEDVAWAITLMTGTMIGLGLVQLTVGNLVARGWYPNALKHAVCLTIMALAAASIVQPVGARLASFALMSTASPAKQCTVFLLRDAQKDVALKPLLAPDSNARTVPFNFVFPSDGQFYVRQKSVDTTIVLDAKAVIATAPCSDDAKKKKDVATTATSQPSTTPAPAQKATGPTAAKR